MTGSTGSEQAPRPVDAVRGDRPATLGQSLLWFGGPFAVALVAYLAVNAASARGLGAARFGDFVTVTTVALLVGQLSLIGVHRSGLREAARITERDDPRLLVLRHDVAAVERLLLPVGAVVAGLTVAVPVGHDLPARASLGVATAALTYVSGEQQLWASYLRGFGDARAAGLLEGRSGGVLVVVSQAAAMATLYLLWGSSMTLASAVAAMAVGYVAPTLVARQRVNRRWHGIGVRTRELPARVGRLLTSNARFMTTTLTTQLNQYVDVWIASAVLSAFDSSLFSASLRLAGQLTLAAVAIQVAFAPAISRMVGQHDLRRLEQLLRTGATVATLGLVIAWAPLLAVPDEILELVFGDVYAAAAAILVALTVGSAVNVLTGLCGTALMMGGREGIPAAANAIVLAGRVSVGVPVAMVWGMPGLAITSAASTALLNVALAAAVLRTMGLRTWPTLRPRLRLLTSTPA